MNFARPRWLISQTTLRLTKYILRWRSSRRSTWYQCEIEIWKEFKWWDTYLILDIIRIAYHVIWLWRRRSFCLASSSALYVHYISDNIVAVVVMVVGVLICLLERRSYLIHSSWALCVSKRFFVASVGDRYSISFHFFCKYGRATTAAATTTTTTTTTSVFIFVVARSS